MYQNSTAITFDTSNLNNKNMKNMKIMAWVLMIFLANATMAQNYNSTKETNTNSLPYKVKIGYNLANVMMSPEPLNLITSKSGFHVGLAFDLPQTKRGIGLSTEILYSHQGFRVAKVGTVGMHYLSVPLLLNLPVTKDAKISFGPQVSYLINSRIGIGSDLFSINYNGLFKKFNADLVGGVEIKVGPKYSVGGRYLLGLNDINKDFDFGTKSLNDIVSIKNSTAQFFVKIDL